MKLLRLLAISLVLCSIFLAGCGKGEVKDIVNISVDYDSIPTMVTREVKTVISDSGMAKYRISSKLWIVYDEGENPRWKFPVGLYLEKFDSKFNVEAHIKCDSATYFKKDKLWRLDGDVEIKNTANEEFLTEQLFWSQSKHEVYSDSFIHIVKSDRIIEGYGFKSNERMTSYQINKPSGIFPIDEERSGIANTNK